MTLTGIRWRALTDEANARRTAKQSAPSAPLARVSDTGQQVLGLSAYRPSWDGAHLSKFADPQPELVCC